MENNIAWTDDCSGKKDYDGVVLRISTRYWPRGGSTFICDGGGFRKHDDGRKPYAHSGLLLGGYNDYVTISESGFEGETFEEVAKLVESWAQEQMDKVETVLSVAFKNSMREE